MVYTTAECVLALGKSDPELEALLGENPFAARHRIPPVNVMRDQNNKAELRAHNAIPKLGTEDLMNIPMRDGYQLQIRIVKPLQPPSEGSPLIALAHGGGFVTGTNLHLACFAHPLAAAYGATVVLLTYRLAPEHKFPTAAHDIWDSIQWLSQHASDLGADLSKGFILGGVSAGANLIIANAHRAVRENLTPKLTGLWACIPPIASGPNIPEKYKPLWLSREQNREAPCLSTADMDALQGMYGADCMSEDATPFLDESSFSKMPPTHVQVSGMDPVRDDGLIYERMLREHGVKTRLDVYAGMPHGHHLFFPGLKKSQKLFMDVVDGMGWLLGRESGVDRIELEQFFACLGRPTA